MAFASTGNAIELEEIKDGPASRSGPRRKPGESRLKRSGTDDHQDYPDDFDDFKGGDGALDTDEEEDSGGQHGEEGDDASERGLLQYFEDPAPSRDAKDSAEPEDSPYAEVRASVHNYDQDLPCNTIRAWTIGLVLVVAGSAMNTLFSLRQPSISITSLVTQVVAWPLGHAWARFVPDFRPFTPLGFTASLNPRPFNVKEHAIIVVMASVSLSVSYATDVILAQLVFYKQDFGVVFQLGLIISSQSLGYGIAGILRKFLVYPASMIWPGNLASVALLNVMYDPDERDTSVFGGRMPRYHWFSIVTVLCMIYSIIPGYLARCLSVFAVITWFAPRNPVVNQLFGGLTGLSLLPISFDWAQASGYVGSPLLFPWDAIANIVCSVIIFNIIGTCIVHYSGGWYGQYLPISDSATYDHTGAPYNVTRVLNANFTLNETAYKAYSPLFISTAFAMTYGLSFAAISSLIVYTVLHNGKRIWHQYRNSTSEKPDIHMKLMRKYPEAPDWWYLSLLGIMILLGLYVVLAFPTNMTWWAFLLAVLISFGFSLPIGIIQAVTNLQLGLNVLTEFIFGYIQPGRPLALMIFKTFGYITMTRALDFVEDLKFGHYMKIPPRTMFASQVVATTVACLVQLVVLRSALASIEGVCTHDQPESFTCPSGNVFFSGKPEAKAALKRPISCSITPSAARFLPVSDGDRPGRSASIIWGLIGPSRMFSPGQVYAGLLGFFAVGAVSSAAVWAVVRRWPGSWLRHVMVPLVFGGAGKIPPATPLNYLVWGAVGWLFQYHIRRRHFAWWRRLNFITSSGLDLGLGLATLIIFFAFTLQRIPPPAWWGNNIVHSTMDFQGTAVQRHVPEGGHFGPSQW